VEEQRRNKKSPIQSKSLTIRIFTSNCISRLFWFGSAGGRILKMAQQIFKKEQKQRRCSYAAPPAAEAKGVKLKER
jgi:hypothetical protein